MGKFEEPKCRILLETIDIVRLSGTIRLLLSKSDFENKRIRFRMFEGNIDGFSDIIIDRISVGDTGDMCERATYRIFVGLSNIETDRISVSVSGSVGMFETVGFILVKSNFENKGI